MDVELDLFITSIVGEFAVKVYLCARKVLVHLARFLIEGPNPLHGPILFSKLLQQFYSLIMGHNVQSLCVIDLVKFSKYFGSIFDIQVLIGDNFLGVRRFLEFWSEERFQICTITQTINNVDGRSFSTRASCPIVPDILTRQHEHRSGLIWSGDHETLIGLLLSLTHFSGYKVKKDPLKAWILREFTGSEIDDDLILRAHEFIFLLLGGHMLSDFSGNLTFVHDSFRRCKTDRGSPCPSSDLGSVAYSGIAASATPACLARPSCSTWCDVVHIWRQHIREVIVLPVEELSNPRNNYIRWYRDITRVYIDNPANHDTRTVGYQPARVDRRMMTSMLQEVDDMATRVIQGLLSCPTQIASFAKKVQTIIQGCMFSIGGTLGYTPSQHDIQQIFPTN
ncbi:hypothetical protein M9H77_09437 [Catharanthus roseus]|uniref:Uncharacterized protein n=1 Tax=Catharanthus roseus TaxID=4058 RepID=A0ACC0C0K8_CATRO|nr:hypothetical protein M9H77_09437 [Catharanthus roseus]